MSIDPDKPALVIELLDRDGNVLERHDGSTPNELKKAHEKGQCDFLCSICYAEACDWHLKTYGY
jgi:hypothetical protein